MKDSRLPGSMRTEALHMEQRAEVYRELASQLDAKAAKLRREAERIERGLRSEDKGRPSAACVSLNQGHQHKRKARVAAADTRVTARGDGTRAGLDGGAS